jgi:hypothetical protein
MRPPIVGLREGFCVLPDMKLGITAAVAPFIRDRLVKAWEELEYRIDTCRVTHEAHIECL